MTDKKSTFSGVQTLAGMLGGSVVSQASKPRQLIAGDCAFNVTTRRGPNRQVVAHAWLWALASQAYLADARNEVLKDLQVEGVSAANIRKVVDAITPEQLEAIRGQARSKALEDEAVRKLTAIPLVVEQYANLHGGSTQGFYNRIIMRIDGVREDVQREQAGVNQEQMAAADAPDAQNTSDTF